MEINRDNFDVVFPKVKQLLKTCEFFAFDLEMTGINPVRLGRGVDPELVARLPHQCRFYSTPDELFASKWEAASTFSPMQLGLSIFHPKTSDSSIQALRSSLTLKASNDALDEFVANGRDKALAFIRELQRKSATALGNIGSSTTAPPPLEVLNSVASLDALMAELNAVELHVTRSVPQSSAGAPLEYVASTFYCHLFPSWHFGDGELKMSIETVGDFLASHNMDFNAWVRNSLLVCPREALHEQRLARIRAASSAGSSGSGGASRQENPKFDQSSLAEVPRQDLNQVTNSFAILEQFAEDNLHNKAAASPPRSLPFLGEVAFRIVTQKAKSLGLRIQSGSISWASASPCAGKGVSTTSTSSHQGTLLIESIYAAGKPVIVHNSWSDLLFLYRATHSTPLQTYPQFKEAVKKLIPNLFDTRTLCSLDIMQSIGNVRGPLDKTYDLFRKRHEGVTTTVTLSDGFAEGAQAPHNAAFDAYMTGSLFLYCREEIVRYERGSSGEGGLASSSQGSPAGVAAGSRMLQQLTSIIPVYASIFSIALNQSCDVLIQSTASPVFYAVPNADVRGGAFTDRLGAVLNKANLPAIVMNCGDAALAFVTRDAKGTGSLLESSVQQAVRDFMARFGGAGSSAKLIDMKVSDFIAKSGGRLRFLEL